MIRRQESLQIHRPQLHLVAHRLAQPRLARPVPLPPPGPGLAFRQVAKQQRPRHPHLPPRHTRGNHPIRFMAIKTGPADIDSHALGRAERAIRGPSKCRASQEKSGFSGLHSDQAPRVRPRMTHQCGGGSPPRSRGGGTPSLRAKPHLSARVILASDAPARAEDPGMPCEPGEIWILGSPLGSGSEGSPNLTTVARSSAHCGRPRFRCRSLLVLERPAPRDRCGDEPSFRHRCPRCTRHAKIAQSLGEHRSSWLCLWRRPDPLPITTVISMHGRSTRRMRFGKCALPASIGGIWRRISHECRP